MMAVDFIMTLINASFVMSETVKRAIDDILGAIKKRSLNAESFESFKIHREEHHCTNSYNRKDTPGWATLKPSTARCICRRS